MKIFPLYFVLAYENKNLNDLLYGYIRNMYLDIYRMLRGLEKYDSDDEDTKECLRRFCTPKYHLTDNPKSYISLLMLKSKKGIADPYEMV